MYAMVDSKYKINQINQKLFQAISRWPLPDNYSYASSYIYKHCYKHIIMFCDEVVYNLFSTFMIKQWPKR